MSVSSENVLEKLHNFTNSINNFYSLNIPTSAGVVYPTRNLDWYFGRSVVGVARNATNSKKGVIESEWISSDASEHKTIQLTLAPIRDRNKIWDLVGPYLH